MSGLEVIGVVASIIQIADLGAKLSVKLCTFYKAVKVANKSMQELSSDVSLTCSILNELGKTLEQDDQTRLCSKQAFFTAQEVLQECKSVFEEIDTAIEKHSQDNEKNRLMRHARKITIALLGPDLNVLKSNLEKLKSTTLLMLHVIMYAGQLRKENEKSTMADQRGLIQTLLEEKIANDAKYDTLSKSIQAVSISKDDSAFQPSFKALSIDPQPTPSTPLWNEVGEYYNLVRGLLCQIDAYQDTLEKSRHLRIRNGVINVHSAESVLFQHIHGHAANQLFDDPIFRFRDASFPATHQIHTRSDSTDETAKRGKTRPELSHSSDSEYEPEREKTGKSYVHRERRRDPDKTRGSAESRIDPSEDNLSDFTSYEDCCLTAPALHKRPGFRRARRGSATISRYERGVGDEPLARRDFDESDYYDLPPAYINSHKSEFEERRAEAENGFRRHPHDGIHSHFDHRSWPDPRPDDSIAQAPQRRKKKKRYRHCGSDDSKICIDTDKKGEEDQPMLPPPPQPIKSSSDDGDHDDDILIIDEVTDLIGKPIESKEENWDSSPYVSSEPAPDIITLESLVLQWTTLKPEELLRLDATWRRKEEERYDMNL